METIWQEIQEVLKAATNPGIFAVWIKPLLGSYVDGVLTVEAPNGFVANWVSSRLGEEILKAAEKVTGTRPTLQVNAMASREPKPIPGPLPASASDSARTEQLDLPVAQQPAASKMPKWQYHFDDFVVGPSNELAYAAARNICSQTLPNDNLFISSPAGLGKTHLLQAVGAHLGTMANCRHPRVTYLTAEEFARRMVMALKSGNIESFKARFRDTVDLLLLEDVHFFQGKARMQDELLATLKALRNNGSKVVFSSSFLPREIKELDSQLASRFCSGFLTVIEKPDLETRRRILAHKAKSFQVDLPENVAELLAERIDSDVRQLESCLQNLVLKARLLNRHITEEMAWDVLGQYASDEARLSIEGILDFICKSFEISSQSLRSKSRQRQAVMARNMAFFLARRYTDLSLKDIGDRLNRKHSTVLKGIANVEREMNLETPLGRQLSRTAEMLHRFPGASGQARN